MSLVICSYHEPANLFRTLQSDCHYLHTPFSTQPYKNNFQVPVFLNTRKATRCNLKHNFYVPSLKTATVSPSDIHQEAKFKQSVIRSQKVPTWAVRQGHAVQANLNEYRIKVKVKVNIPYEAQRGWIIALFTHPRHQTEASSQTPLPGRCNPGKDPDTHCRDGWVSMEKRKSPALERVRTPDRPTYSVSLY